MPWTALLDLMRPTRIRPVFITDGCFGSDRRPKPDFFAIGLIPGIRMQTGFKTSTAFM